MLKTGYFVANCYVTIGICYVTIGNCYVTFAESYTTFVERQWPFYCFLNRVAYSFSSLTCYILYLINLSNQFIAKTAAKFAKIIDNSQFSILEIL
jgi:hypothetical protein